VREYFMSTLVSRGVSRASGWRTCMWRVDEAPRVGELDGCHMDPDEVAAPPESVCRVVALWRARAIAHA
jgi:hypothetical protein